MESGDEIAFSCCEGGGGEDIRVGTERNATNKRSLFPEGEEFLGFGGRGHKDGGIMAEDTGQDLIIVLTSVLDNTLQDGSLP